MTEVPEAWIAAAAEAEARRHGFCGAPEYHTEQARAVLADVLPLIIEEVEAIPVLDAVGQRRDAEMMRGRILDVLRGV
jgi:hypothetical protein